MDFILFYSGLKDTAIKYFMVSYDIGTKISIPKWQKLFPCLGTSIPMTLTYAFWCRNSIYLPILRDVSNLFLLIMPSLLVGVMEELLSADSPFSMVLLIVLEKWDLEHVRTLLRTI